MEEDKTKNICDRTIRILDVMKEVNMNATQFSEAIGIQRATMSHIMSGRNNPSADVIVKIAERFRMINPGWLLTGNGQMKLTSETDANSEYTAVNPASGATQSQTARQPGLFDPDPDDDEPALASHDVPQSAIAPAGAANSPSANAGKSDHTFKAKQNSASEPPIPREIRFTDEIRNGETLQSPEDASKIIEKEVIIYKERPVKTIDKLLIFYSDHTYETFIPEKSEKKG